jgi:hypothetical protein
MKSVVILILVLAPFPGIACAAAIWETGPEQGAVSMRYIVQDGRLRIEGYRRDGELGSITLLYDNTEYNKLPGDPSWWRCDPKCMQALVAEARRKYDSEYAALRSRPEEEKAKWRAEQAAHFPPTLDVRQNGTLQVAGHQCTVWEVRHGQRRVLDACTTSFQSFPGGAELESMWKARQKRWQPVDEANLKYAVGPQRWPSWKLPSQVPGMPLRVVIYRESGERVTVIFRGTKIEPVAPDLFTMPAGVKIEDRAP